MLIFKTSDFLNQSVLFLFEVNFLNDLNISEMIGEIASSLRKKISFEFKKRIMMKTKKKLSSFKDTPIWLQASEKEKIKIFFQLIDNIFQYKSFNN